LRRVVVIVAGIAMAGALALLVPPSVIPPPPPHPLPTRADDLVVVVRPGPIVYFPGPEGGFVGFDVDLVRLFAQERKMSVRFVPADSAADLFAAVERGEAHFAVGGLLRPAPPRPPLGVAVAQVLLGAPADLGPAVLWTTGYYAVEPVLIYNSDGFKPANWDDLDGETVAYVESVGLEPEIARLRAAHPEVTFRPMAIPSPSELVAQVSDGTLSYAIVGSLAAAVARNIYLEFDVAFPIGGKRDIAWAVSPHNPKLAQDIDRFLARAKRDGTIARLVERYIPEGRQFLRIDAVGLQEKMRTLLPQYRPLFRDTQAKTGLDWRLLAAISYQESKWDSSAQSETGVRGFMQLTEDTAKLLGVTNLLDPAQNVLAAARYLRGLKDKLPQRIAEPDRTWLALAAYNIGLGHLEDARILAQKQGLNPDHWSDVKKVLPLLALPEYHEQAKLGYARGGMPVAFVDRVRGYYDVLLAHEAASQPRLRLFADAPASAPMSEAAIAKK